MADQPKVRLRNILILLGLVFGPLSLLAIPGALRENREANVRSAMSRVRSDQRSLATMIESYYADHNAYPAMRLLAGFSPSPDFLTQRKGTTLSTIEPGIGQDALHGITTPVAYITSLFHDPFTIESRKDVLPFAYYTDGAKGWILISAGPDRVYDITDPAKVYDPAIPQPSPLLLNEYTYDPTNGIVSPGDIWRVRN